MLVATSILVLMSTNSIFCQVYCEDDGQCTDGLFCERATFACRPCMDCRDLNRSPLPVEALDEDMCVKSDDDCGPCLESYTTNQWNSKCVVPEEESFFSPNTVWLTCAALGLLIMGIFVHLVIHTNVYEIVAYCDCTYDILHSAI